MQEFPPFRLDPVNQCLWRFSATADDERILLPPRAFDVLRYLVAHAGRLVTQEELLEAVWQDTYVQPEVLRNHVFTIRRVLGDSPTEPRFVETLPRRGYRFIAAVSDRAAAEPPGPTSSAPAPMVGREPALEALRGYLRQAVRGQRQLVFVTGEAGIGKTTLVDTFQREVMAEVPKVRIGRGQCLEGYGGKEAYYPMLEALGQLCRGAAGAAVVQTLASQAPTWLVQFPALLTRDHRETLQRELLGATRERMLREINEALETLTSDSPLLLVFEDLQWVDHATVDLLAALARGRAPAHLLLLGTYRSEDVALADHSLQALTAELLVHGLCHELPLEPLGEPDVTAYLAAAAAGAAVPEGLAGLVHERSEGNPLFMVAVLDDLTERGLLARATGRWQLRVPLEDIDHEVPESLRRVIEARIARLSLEEQRALEGASVAGVVFATTVSTVATDLDQDAFEDLCARLARRQQIVRAAGTQPFPDGSVSSRYEFTHALYREVCYGRLAPGRRARLHRRVGERLEALFAQRPRDAAPELAHHFEAGAEWARAVTYLQLAAETAGRRYAPREATAILQHALAVVNNLPEAERAVPETAMLETLAQMYQLFFDMRALDTCETLVARAAHYGLLDMEVRALLGMAIPLAWISPPRCREVLERALRLSATLGDPILRAYTRGRCLVRRIWVSEWNPDAAAECRTALTELRQAGDRLALASLLIDYSFLQWCSSAYRQAHQSVVESRAILVEGGVENPSLSLAYRESQHFLPWVLLFLGEWGEALRELTAAITMGEKNGDARRVQTFRVYQAWVHLHALDFAGVLALCESLLPVLGDPVRSMWRRFCLVLAGTAATALGNYERTWRYLVTAREEMERQMVLLDWHCRLLLESALTELWLAQGDLAQARPQAERFLQVTLATEGRTWQALAWEAQARVAAADLDLQRAQECIAQAVVTMEGFEVPLAAWRVHATAAALYARMGRSDVAAHHRALSRTTILQLANSLPADEPLRSTFLAAPAVVEVLGNAERTGGSCMLEPSSSP
jgi:DNA-binding winged helix-turn-helix (wHTH) protein/tetratricopeptide (TPR) repeat protein